MSCYCLLLSAPTLWKVLRNTRQVFAALDALHLKFNDSKDLHHTGHLVLVAVIPVFEAFGCGNTKNDCHDVITSDAGVASAALQTSTGVNKSAAEPSSLEGVTFYTCFKRSCK